MPLKNLSMQAQSLWAKKSRKGDLLFLPLFVHLSDAAAVARKLWNQWLSPGVKLEIEKGLSDPAQGEELFVFLMAAHDLGKATPLFQSKNTGFPSNDLDDILYERIVFSGLPMKPFQIFTNPVASPHALATQLLLEQAGCSRNITVILGAHHGKPPDAETILYSNIDAYEENYYLEETGKKSWIAVQNEYIQYALALSGFASIDLLPTPAMHIQVLLSGLVIMADWIASNEFYFPYFEVDKNHKSFDSVTRGDAAWDEIDFPCAWPPYDYDISMDLYKERFQIDSPYPVQKLAVQVSSNIRKPGIFVVEAPMGMGKTEIAEVVSEIFAYKAQRTGIFFALPTQATSNAIFSRLLDWTANLDIFSKYTVNLAHGKAQFNDTYQSLFEGGGNIAQGEDDAFVHHWFEGSKKSLLADFVVGTIDQLLFAALSQKHVMLRHLGLANKVVIIDECHAYDAYMNQYLKRALRWLGAYNTPVIILSATLPVKMRNQLIDAYLGKRNETEKQLCAVTSDQIDRLAYPVLTYSDDDEVKQAESSSKKLTKTIAVHRLSDEQAWDRLAYLLSEGGCAGVVMNTVARAQEAAHALRTRFGDEHITLIHSQFIVPDRTDAEKRLLKMLGKPGAGTSRPHLHIVVGTQVIEQSLDIDFDVLMTDLCPMDLLLQRIGRLHRHDRERPEQLSEGHCYVLGAQHEEFDKGALAVYGEYLLMRTKALLPQQFILPTDIPYLVQATYEDDFQLQKEPLGYIEAREKYQSELKDKEERADAFRVKKPSKSQRANMLGWLRGNVGNHEKKGEAAVRDGGQSIEVQVVYRQSQNKISLLPWINEGSEIDKAFMPDKAMARSIARQTLRLPHALCHPWLIDQTISELEEMSREVSAWQLSPWLKGELFLVLNEQLSASLSGFYLVYSREDGLIYKKESESIG